MENNENLITVPIEEEITDSTEVVEELESIIQVIEETETTESIETTEDILAEYPSYDYTEQLILVNENLNNLNYTMNCFFVLGIGLVASMIVYKFVHRFF